MGFQASQELGEGDMRLRVTRLLSPIRSGSPRKEIGEHVHSGDDDVHSGEPEDIPD